MQNLVRQTLVAMATTFALGAESNCLPACLSVCLSVCRITEKVVNGFRRNYLEGWGNGPGTNEFNFSRDPDHRPDPGVLKSEIQIHWIIEKVPSGLTLIKAAANLHCKNHSAILLCWRSAEVSALWVLLVVVVVVAVIVVLLGVGLV